MQSDVIFGENREKILRYKRYRDLAYGGGDPIYTIITLKGVPGLCYDLDSIEYDGFYHNLDDAVCAMHLNVCDLHNGDRDFGFVICEFPGIVSDSDPEGRIFFVWDNIKDGFYEAEEPQFFKGMRL